ncbi:Thioredoxin [Amycolatopsis arida]|uniref:Thioredoxin n=1 Tax=Amycolatopsis arida TaxID=587909 RepID=A0A1I5SWE2_9PSEU|nr:thioredoxin family protein [Amycolatopsis arida]TDX96338.1 thioredoxin [Amycolatopsis arida]SFP74546.1 Thioredoxin [Amycolatopsis arida]
MIGLWVVLGTLALGLVTGVTLALRNGRVRAARRPDRPLPTAVAEAVDPTAAVTLVQLSTTFCAPCRHARAVLSTLADRTEGLRHVDLDITQRPEVAQRLGVLRTPTTLALDANARELLRISGVPKAAELLDALRPHLVRVR